MKASVFSIEGTDTGRKVELADAIYKLKTPNDHAIYQDVRNILAKRRQGTSKSKERGEVSATNKKPYRQKGTGNARAGDRKSPLWRGGGTVFGPRPRSYGFRLNKKVKTLAQKSALTYKAKEESIMILEDFAFDAPKTREFAAILNRLDMGQQKVLLVVGENNPNVYLSGRNLPKANVLTADSLNTYDILNADRVLLTEEAVQVINQKFVN